MKIKSRKEERKKKRKRRMFVYRDGTKEDARWKAMDWIRKR